MEDMVLLCTAENAAEALIVKSLLDDHRIRYGFHESSPKTIGYLGGLVAMGLGVPSPPISFYVYEEDHRKAAELLNIGGGKD